MKSLKENNLARYIIILVSVLIIVAFKFIPAPEGLSQSGMAVIGVFLGVLILWLTISIDWPSLLCILALGILPELSFKNLFMASFGSDTFVFLFCTFICTYALSTTNVIKKIALWFVSNKLAKKGPWWFITMFFFSVIFIGMFVSPSVLFVVLLPILEEIYRITKIEKGSKVGKVLMIGLAICVSISSGMTPIAHVFPILSFGIFQNITGQTINYGSYMAIAIPVGIILTILMILVFRIILRPDVSVLKDVSLDEMKKELPKTSARDIVTLVIFGICVLLWVLPSIFQNVGDGAFYKLFNGYGTAFPAIIGVVLLCIIWVDGKPLVNIKDACSKGVPFSSLIMCAGTLALGSAMTNDAIGLKSFLIDNLSSSLAGLAPFVLLIIFALWAAFQTNVSSNMVTATIVTTVAMPIMLAVGSVQYCAICASIIGMLSAFAFATPPSMPHIAIASSSDWANTKDMLIYGSIGALLSVILAVLVGYFMGLLVF